MQLEKIDNIEINGKFNNLTKFLKSNEQLEKLKEIESNLVNIVTINPIRRTYTQIEGSVLNDHDCPTVDSKYWQIVRELSATFTSFLNESTQYEVSLLELEKKQLEIELMREEFEKKKKMEKNEKIIRINEILLKQKELEFSQYTLGFKINQKTINQRVEEMFDLYELYEEKKSNLEYSDSDPNMHQVEAILIKVILNMEIYFYRSRNNKVEMNEIYVQWGLMKTFKKQAEKLGILDKISSKLTKMQLAILNEQFIFSDKMEEVKEQLEDSSKIQIQ